MNKLLTGVSALALAAAFGAGAAYANPTVMNVENVEGNSDVEIGVVDIDVEVDQSIYGVYGGNANGGEGGDANGGDANGSYGGEGGWGGWGGVAGNGADGGEGGSATASNNSSIAIENGNVAVVSQNDLDASNDLYFEDFLNTGDNYTSAEGGDGSGGAGGDASGGEGNGAWAAAEGYAFAAAGNGGEGGPGAAGTGGAGGSSTTGMATLTTGDVSYNDSAFANAAGQFNIAANTGIANINQQGNSVAAHVPVGINTGE